MYISKERRFMNYDDLAWAKLREQQQLVAIDVHDAYMAVLADCGEFDNIHPADKRTPGIRIAAIALKYVYGFNDIPALAPYIIDARRGDGVEVSFGGDFMLLNMATGYDSDDTGFEVAGEDGEFYKASATVDFDGKTIILSCPKVEYPVKVRYGYFSYGATPLYADNGLAATPFSVDVEKTLGGT
jgi:sialate O-acetylesterase